MNETPANSVPAETDEQQVEQPIPIEVKWHIPAWIMRDPGPAIEIEDDEWVEEERTSNHALRI